MQGYANPVDSQVERHTGRYEAQAKPQRSDILLAQLTRIQVSFSFVPCTFYTEGGLRRGGQGERAEA
jgi:hypothetical protein